MTSRFEKCRNCTRIKTPFCGDCSFIVSPSGKEKDPTNFVEGFSLPSDRDELFSRIRDLVNKGASVPLALVDHYNRYVEFDHRQD